MNIPVLMNEGEYEPDLDPQSKIQLDTVVGKIINIAVSGLGKMFEADKNLFCFRRLKKGNRYINEGVSLRYTLISLLGLHAIRGQGIKTRVNISELLALIGKDTDKFKNIGDLGLFIWSVALAMPDQIEKIWCDFQIERALNRYADARYGLTTELSWFLAGLCHVAMADKIRAKGLKALMGEVYSMIKRNYGGKGIFGHMSRETIKGRIRGRIGSFADQVYPIYSFSKFAHFEKNEDALNIALECGKNIKRHQGQLGQWWWHYDAVTGKMIGRYPVYSVHQDGMAPLALFALGEETGINFDEPIYRGLNWVLGNNELHFKLVDWQNNVIWRSLYNRKIMRYWEEALSLISLGGIRAGSLGLKVLRECRAYHLGWLLFAFGDKFSGRSKADMEA